MSGLDYFFLTVAFSGKQARRSNGEVVKVLGIVEISLFSSVEYATLAPEFLMSSFPNYDEVVVASHFVRDSKSENRGQLGCLSFLSKFFDSISSESGYGRF